MAQWKDIVGKGFSPEEFGAYLHSVQFGAWRPSFVVLHNTAIPRFSDWHRVSGEKRIAGFKAYYRDELHWSAGPHLFVADDKIWVFTPLNTPGVHSPSWNSMSIGVEMVGDYAVEPLSDAVRQNTVFALTELHSLLGLDPHFLRLHKEDPLTTHVCPGATVKKAELIHSIAEELARKHSGEHMPDRLASAQRAGGIDV